jgi:DNA helicase HerA-like ATPase
MFYTSVKYPESPDMAALELLSSLSQQEETLTHEYSKLEKSEKIVHSLESQVKYLTKDFIKSESLFFDLKSRLLKSLIDNPENRLLLYDLLSSQPSSKKSLLRALASFSYQSLTDETVEKLLPVWKSSENDLGPCKEIIRFIGVSVEAKMKSDLLNSASDRLIKTINRVETMKVNIGKLRGKIREIKKLLDWDTEEVTRGEEIRTFDSGFLLKSEDLYGMEDGRADSSTVVYTRDEKMCETCLCMPF